MSRSQLGHPLPIITHLFCLQKMVTALASPNSSPLDMEGESAAVHAEQKHFVKQQTEIEHRLERAPNREGLEPTTVFSSQTSHHGG
jgi:hypothetical protein